MASAAVWFGAALGCAGSNTQALKRAGIEGKGFALGLNLFEKILTSPSGFMFTHEDYEDIWRLIKTGDKKIHLAIPELLDWLDRLSPDEVKVDPDYPFMLLGGQRRHYNANQIIRDPKWRKNDPAGALHMHPEDLATTGVSAGGWLAVESRTGRIVVRTEEDARLRRGQISLPHGYGQIYQTPDGEVTIGPRLNILTSTDDCDPIARTPYHKNVAVRVGRPTNEEIEFHETQEKRIAAMDFA